MENEGLKKEVFPTTIEDQSYDVGKENGEHLFHG